MKSRKRNKCYANNLKKISSSKTEINVIKEKLLPVRDS